MPILSCKYYCIDKAMITVTKKEAYMSGLFCASLAAYIPNVTFRDNFLLQIITKGCKNDRMGLVPSPASCIYTCRKSNMKKGQKQEKQKHLK